MSDRSDMTLNIGGPIKASDLQDVCEWLADERFATEWDGEQLNDPEQVEDEIRSCVAKGKDLVLCAREIVGGMNEELEAALQDMGVTYSRHSDSHYAYSASLAYWQPGMDKAREWTSDNDGAPFLSAGEILNRLNAGTLQAEVDLMMAAAGSLPPLTIVETADPEGGV
jgi:hypothetical protein